MTGVQACALPILMPEEVAAEAVDQVEAEVEAEAVIAHLEPVAKPEPAKAEAAEPAGPRRTGWWSRAKK